MCVCERENVCVLVLEHRDVCVLVLEPLRYEVWDLQGLLQTSIHIWDPYHVVFMLKGEVFKIKVEDIYFITKISRIVAPMNLIGYVRANIVQ